MRTAVIADPLARANVRDALCGAGRPAGVRGFSEDAERVSVRFDDAVTAPDLIDDLIAVASTFVPQRASAPASLAAAAALVARGTGDPDIDAARVIETYVP